VIKPLRCQHIHHAPSPRQATPALRKDISIAPVPPSKPSRLLVHAALEVTCRHALWREYVHHASPPREAIPVNSTKQALRKDIA
jgi:hypothetical protein